MELQAIRYAVRIPAMEFAEAVVSYEIERHREKSGLDRKFVLVAAAFSKEITHAVHPMRALAALASSA